MDLLKGDFSGIENLSQEELRKAGFINPSQLNDLMFIIKDLCSGDKSAAKDERYNYLKLSQIETAIKWIYQQNDSNLIELISQNPWYLVYKDRPPTPEEFLTSKYIGAMADHVYPHIREAFIEFFSPVSDKRTIILNCSIGAGKSTLTCLIMLYVACLFGLMRDPWTFFDRPRTTVFGYALCAVTQSKASEIYVEPITQLIESSDFWKNCRTHTDMIDEDKHLAECDTVEYLPWTTATKTAQPLDAKVYLPDGSYKLMGDIKVGDVIKSPTTGSTKVMAIPYEGHGECYEIELEDGRKTKCSIDHKWKVKMNGDPDDWIVDTRFILTHPDYSYDIDICA